MLKEIRFKDKIIKGYFIDSDTTKIYDENGIEQEVRVNQGRFKFKKMLVHLIMMHTFNEYIPDKDVHHIDFNYQNNALDNLQYLDKNIHRRLHAQARLKNGTYPTFGKWFENASDEMKKERITKIMNALGGKIGDPSNCKGKLWWTKDGIDKRSFDCPR